MCRWVVAVCGLLTLAWPSVSWAALPDQRGPRKPAATSRVRTVPAPALRWTKKIEGNILGLPIIVGDRIGVLTDKGVLQLRSLATGESVMTVPLKYADMLSADAGGPARAVRAGCAVGKYIVLPIHTRRLGSEPNEIAVIDATAGKVTRTITNRAGVFSALGAGAGVFGYGSHDTRFHVVNPADGKELWAMTTGISCGSAGRFDKTGVYFCGTGGVFAVNRESGELRWRKPMAVARGTDLLALQAAGKILAVGVGSKVTGLSTVSGSENWQVELGSPITGEPCVAGDRSVWRAGSSLVAIDAQGDRAWTRRARRPLKVDPVAGEKQIAVVVGRGRMVLLDADDGEILFATGKQLKRGVAPVWTGTSWLCVGTSGDLLCFAPTDRP